MWKDMKLPTQMSSVEETGVSMDMLHAVGKATHSHPDTFNLHRTLKRELAGKAAMFESGTGINWSTGEALAMGTLLLEGNIIRFSGQDVERGTFSHRHAVLTDQKTGEKYVPINHIAVRFVCP
jgi:2-oxoglutarate dehydrogenase E1 component